MKVPPRTVMAAIDFSAFTDIVLPGSLFLCRTYSARLLLVHVTVDASTLLEHNETTLDVNALQKENIRHAEKNLRDLVESVDVETDCIVAKGAPANEISRLASEHNVDLVVAATHGRSGFKRLLIGSVTERLLKTLSCPILVLHAQEQDARFPAKAALKMERILVGCDFSPDSEMAVDYALRLAHECGAELHLSHVIKPSFYTAKLAESKELHARLAEQLDGLIPEVRRSGWTVKKAVLDGEPYLELMKYATQHDIDMIVVGIRGHTLWEKWLVGSTTDRLVRHTQFPVLAVRQG